MMTPALTLGLDIGATSTRALVIDTRGDRLGSGRGPGANVTAHALDDALAAISGAVREALAGIDDPALVRHAVVGTAGTANLDRPAVAEAFRRMWQDAGLSCPYEIVSDALVAFVAGTAEPDGTLLLSGTGALAARFEQRHHAHTVDGHGWLLGDMGSGFWLGREAVRAALSTLDELVTPGPLVRAVLHTTLGRPGDAATMHGALASWEAADSPTSAEYRKLAAALVMNVHSRPPVALAELAPLVSQAAGDDPVADRILNWGAGHLIETAATVRHERQDGTPLVLAGSLLTSDTPLRRLVEPRLAALWPKADITVATDGAAGAAWLAASQLLGPDTPESAKLHARLL